MVTTHYLKAFPGSGLLLLKQLKGEVESFLAKLFDKVVIHGKQNTFRHVKIKGSDYFQNFFFCCEIFDAKIL